MAIINVGYTELFITLKMDSFGSEHSTKKDLKIYTSNENQKANIFSNNSLPPSLPESSLCKENSL